MASEEKPKETLIYTDISVPGQEDFEIELITIDCSVDEVHSGENEVSSDPREEGSNTTDHNRPLPDGLMMNGLITNTPATPGQTKRMVQSGNFQFYTDAEEPRPRNMKGRAEAVADLLYSLKDRGIALKVITGIRRYRSMVIKTISIPRDKSTFDSLKFSVKFERIDVVRNKLTSRPVSRDRRTQEPKNKGAQVPKPVNSPAWDLKEKVGDGLTGAIKSFGG